MKTAAILFTLPRVVVDDIMKGIGNMQNLSNIIITASCHRNVSIVGKQQREWKGENTGIMHTEGAVFLTDMGIHQVLYML